MPDLSITTLKLSELTHDPDNMKTHTDEQIEHLAASIKRFGFNDPIGVWGPDNLIVEGHGRALAAETLNIKTVPVIRMDDMSNEDRRAYAIAHNQHTLSTPINARLVVAEFARIGVDDDDTFASGFSMEDMLFLEPEDFDGEDQGADGTSNESWTHFIPPVYRTVIQFDQDRQKIVWSEFLRAVETRYPEAQTIAERIDCYVVEFGPEPEA